MNKSLVGSVLLLASLPVLAHGDGEHMSGILGTMLHNITSADHLFIHIMLVALGLLAAWALQKPVLRATGLGATLAGAIMLLGSGSGPVNTMRTPSVGPQIRPSKAHRAQFGYSK